MYFTLLYEPVTGQLLLFAHVSSCFERFKDLNLDLTPPYTSLSFEPCITPWRLTAWRLSSECRLRQSGRRRGRRGRLGGRLDRGRCHPAVGGLRGPGDGLQRLEQGEAVPWPPEPHRAGAEVHGGARRPGGPDQGVRDRGGRHRTGQIR